MVYRHTIGSHTYGFRDLKDLMAKATPARSGDYLAGIAAETYAERMAARMCLADIPMKLRA
jgi:ethanolamine ammonia-lyase large subunit